MTSSPNAPAPPRECAPASHLRGCQVLQVAPRRRPGYSRGACAIAAALLAIAAPAAAQLHKCTTQDGRTIYSDRACGAGAASAPIVARPIAAPTQRDAAAAAARRASAAEAAREIDRRQAVAAAQTRAIALDDAAARVDEIKRRNFDPRRCVQARQSIANRRAADPIGWRLDSSVFELEAAARLYCGP